MTTVSQDSAHQLVRDAFNEPSVNDIERSVAMGVEQSASNCRVLLREIYRLRAALRETQL